MRNAQLEVLDNTSHSVSLQGATSDKMPRRWCNTHHKEPVTHTNEPGRAYPHGCRTTVAWRSVPDAPQPTSIAEVLASYGLYKIAMFNDRTIERAYCGCAQACLMAGCAPIGLAFALAAIRCNGLEPPQEVLHSAAVACAALRQPQAALYFLQMVCSPSICRCLCSRRPPSASARWCAIVRLTDNETTWSARPAGGALAYNERMGSPNTRTPCRWCAVWRRARATSRPGPHANPPLAPG